MMEELPDELIVMVFSFLSAHELVGTCSLVCRRWAELAEWRVLQVKEPDDMHRMHAGLRALHVTLAHVDLHPLLDAAAQLTRLTRLTIHAVAPLCQRHVSALDLLPHLRHLDVFTRTRVLDGSMVPVFSRLTSLVVNETLKQNLLRRISTNNQITAFHMYGRSLHFWRRELSLVLTGRASYLTELTLRCPELQDSAYKVIGTCENLTTLQLYSCWLLTRIGVVHVTRPRKLICLHLTGARLVRHKALSNMLGQLPPDLLELSLSATWFSDDLVEQLTQSAPSIRVLELWRCRYLTSDGILDLAKRLPDLQTLDLNLSLTAPQLEVLSKHSKLCYIRCIPDQSTSVVTVGNITVVSTYARFPSKFFRSGGEGYRCSLFYYWTRGVVLEPIPHYVPPTYNDYEEY